MHHAPESSDVRPAFWNQESEAQRPTPNNTHSALPTTPSFLEGGPAKEGVIKMGSFCSFIFVGGCVWRERNPGGEVLYDEKENLYPRWDGHQEEARSEKG
jgi:hypothetical protein